MRHSQTINFTDFATKYNNMLTDNLLPTPYSIMEYIICCKGKTIVLAARPAMGKTALMLSLIKESPQVPILVFSLEMAAIQLINRFLIVTGEKHKPDTLIADNLVSISSPILINKKRNLFINDTSGINFEIMKIELEKQQKELQVEVVFIDYYQLMDDPDGKLLCQIKEIAQNLNITIVLLSPMNRSIDKNPLAIPDILSISINESSLSYVDEVLYLVRPDIYDISLDERGNNLENTAFIYCLKGSLQNKTMRLKFCEQTASFEQANILDIIQ
jgi:replicative DNA helicase